MRKIKTTLKKYNIKPYRYKLTGSVIIVECDSGKYVLKPRDRNKSNVDIYEYLDTRTFDYYPKIISDDNDDYEITEYVPDIEMPVDQKMHDMIMLVSLLHNKTTYYKEVNESDYKELYENITNNIEYLHSYYDDIASVIETKVYMSPAEYLLIRNISKINSALNFCKNEVEFWYELVKEKRKQRFVVLHNNLSEEHFIKNKSSYLISWNKSKHGIPIFDLYKLYKRHALDIEFSEIYKIYERSYPLLEEERKLFFILIALPDKIEFDGTTYDMCRAITKFVDVIYKTEDFLSPYYSKETVENKGHQ